MYATHSSRARSFVLLFYLLGGHLFAQDAAEGHLFAQDIAAGLKGRVVNAEGLPLAKVIVQLDRENSVCITDQEGAFILSPLKDGVYKLTFTHIGFNPKSVSSIQVKGEVRDLGEIVLVTRILPIAGMEVISTRLHKQPFELPMPFNLVSAEDITTREAKTTAEALREEPGLAVQKTNHGGGSAIIRGLSSNQILLLVDGIRLNNATYRLGNHQYLTTVDANMLSQMEVVRGPNSVLYGSDALGGTINLVSKTPPFAASGAHVDYALASRYASADQEKMLHGACIYSSRIWALSAGASYQDFGDLKRGENSRHPELEKSPNGAVQSPSGYEAYDAHFKLIAQPLSRQVWTLAYQLSRQEKVPRYDKYENEGFYRWLYDPQKRDLLYVNIENSLPGPWLRIVKTSLSWHRQEEGRIQQQAMDKDVTIENDIVQTLGAGITLNATIGSHTQVAGLEIYHDRVASKTDMIDMAFQTKIPQARGRYPDGATYFSMGVFAEDYWKMTSRCSMILGARCSSYRTEFVGDSSMIQQTFSALTGSLGLVYAISPQINLSGNLGQGFRAPNLSDISKLGRSKGMIYEVPNLHLQPEKMLNYEVGIKIQTDKLVAALAGYQAAIYDLLGSAGTAYRGSTTILIDGDTCIVKSKQNLGQAFIRGMEVSFDYALLNKIHLFGNANYVIGENSTLDEPVGGIPPAYGLIGIRNSTTRYTWNVFSRFAAKQRRLSSDDLDDPRIPAGGTPGWVILCLRTTVKVRSGCVLHMGIENLFDVNYREHGSGINAPGRNFILGLHLGSH